MRSRKSASRKLTVVLLSVILVLCCTIGGSLAWLMDTSNTVTNTFTVGDIDIVLKEHSLVNGVLSGKEVEANIEDTYKILPGTTQPKDPFVRFTKESEACWLFVKIDEENNTVAGKNYKYVTYTVDSAWKSVEGTTNVYYIDLTNGGLVNARTEKNILADLQVSYSSELTKEDLNSVTDNNEPQLIFTAYAVQKEAANDAAAAWNLVKDNAA